MQVVYPKMAAALTTLTKSVSTIQLTGDYQAADALFKTYVSEDQDGVTLNGALGEIRESIIAKFKASGIQSPSLRYRIKGLPR